VGQVFAIDDPSSPLYGGSYPIVRVLRYRGQWGAMVCLPNGLTRRVLVRTPGMAPRPTLDQEAFPEFRELFKHRQWIQSRIARMKGQEDPSSVKAPREKT
jgi:hypothetical protein